MAKKSTGQLTFFEGLAGGRPVDAEQWLTRSDFTMVDQIKRDLQTLRDDPNPSPDRKFYEERIANYREACLAASRHRSG